VCLVRTARTRTSQYGRQSFDEALLTARQLVLRTRGVRAVREQRARGTDSGKLRQSVNYRPSLFARGTSAPEICGSQHCAREGCKVSIRPSHQ
jgi:hypothetical protein